MKKVFTLILVVAMSLCVLCACNKEITDIKNVKGTVVETESIKALCPDGWVSKTSSSLDSEDDEATNTLIFFNSNSRDVSLYDELIGIYSYVKIEYYEDGIYAWKDNYSDNVDVSVTLNGVTWSGFTGYDSDYNCFTFYYSADKFLISGNVSTIQVTVFLNGRKSELTEDSIFVQAILNSIEIK